MNEIGTCEGQCEGRGAAGRQGGRVGREGGLGGREGGLGGIEGGLGGTFVGRAITRRGL